MNRYITARAKPLQDAADILDPHESHGPTTGLHTAERDAISVTFHDDDWEAYLGDLGIDTTDPLHDRNPDEMTVSELNEFHQWLQAENMWATQESDFDARLATLEKALPAAIQRSAALKDELALAKEKHLENYHRLERQALAVFAERNSLQSGIDKIAALIGIPPKHHWHPNHVVEELRKQMEDDQTLPMSERIATQIQIEGDRSSIREFGRLLAAIQWCCTTGSSRTIRVTIDGDGSASLRFYSVDSQGMKEDHIPGLPEADWPENNQFDIGE